MHSYGTDIWCIMHHNEAFDYSFALDCCAKYACLYSCINLRVVWSVYVCEREREREREREGGSSASGDSYAAPTLIHGNADIAQAT